jgi:hypothetical protein
VFAIEAKGSPHCLIIYVTHSLLNGVALPFQGQAPKIFVEVPAQGRVQHNTCRDSSCSVVVQLSFALCVEQLGNVGCRFEDRIVELHCFVPLSKAYCPITINGCERCLACIIWSLAPVHSGATLPTEENFG